MANIDSNSKLAKHLNSYELLNRIWADSFVEESNLSRYIYRLRKTFQEYGESEDLIQTVPRRGYRFTGQINENSNSNTELIIEKHSISRTVIEELENSIEPQTKILKKRTPQINHLWLGGLVFLTIFTLGFGYYFYSRNGEPNQPIKSIAVLPLKTFSNSLETEELRLRITDAVITKLGGLKDIMVRPTNSIVRFVKEDTDAILAGKQLEVEAILDGRIQIEGENLRVTLQLVSIESGKQMWSGQFDGKIDEILSLQDKISTALLPRLSNEQNSIITKNPTDNSEAYELYLKGRYFWNQRTPASYLKAIEFYQKATQIDPDFALAYSGLADCYILLNQRTSDLPQESLVKAEQAAQKAITLNPNLAETRTSVGLLRSVYRRNWQESEENFQQAIEINPNYAIAYGWYGVMLSGRGRFDEAEKLIRQAIQIDPTSRNLAIYLAVNFYYQRHFDKAIEQSKKALELDPKLTTALMYQSLAFEQKKMFDEAVRSELERQAIVDPQMVELLQNAYNQSGIRGFWQKQIEIRQQQADKYSTCGYEIATRFALLDKQIEALDMIEDNFEYGGTCWTGIGVEPAFESLRKTSRFTKILAQMNLK